MRGTAQPVRTLNSPVPEKLVLCEESESKTPPVSPCVPPTGKARAYPNTPSTGQPVRTPHRLARAYPLVEAEAVDVPIVHGRRGPGGSGSGRDGEGGTEEGRGADGEMRKSWRLRETGKARSTRTGRQRQKERQKQPDTRVYAVLT